MLTLFVVGLLGGHFWGLGDNLNRASIDRGHSFWFKIRYLLFLLPSRQLYFLVRGGTCPHGPYRLIAYDLLTHIVYIHDIYVNAIPGRFHSMCYCSYILKIGHHKSGWPWYGSGLIFKRFVFLIPKDNSEKMAGWFDGIFVFIV